jgi:hypothetical protein
MRLSILLSIACIHLGIGHAQPGSETEPAVISGLVLDAYSGIPVPGAMIYLVEAKSRSAVPLNDSVLTDAAGKYRFPNLAPIGEMGFGYVVRVKAQRYAYTQTNVFNVAAGQNLIQDFNLVRLLSLSLIVRDSADKTVLLSGAKVTLIPAAGMSAIRTAETDSLGWIRFADLGMGDVGITIVKHGYRTLVSTRLLDGGGWGDTVWAAMRKDSAGENRSLQGTLKSHTAEIVPGYPFFFQCQALSGTAYLYTVSGTDGRFRFEGVPRECATGAYFKYPDSASVTLTGTSTEADFIVTKSAILEVRSTRKSPAGISAWAQRFKDFNVLGRKRR